MDLKDMERSNTSSNAEQGSLKAGSSQTNPAEARPSGRDLCEGGACGGLPVESKACGTVSVPPEFLKKDVSKLTGPHGAPMLS